MKVNKNLDKKMDIKHDNNTSMTQHIQEQQWLKKNKEAIEEHNKLIEKHGCFSDAYRRF